MAVHLPAHSPRFHHSLAGVMQYCHIIMEMLLFFFFQAHARAPLTQSLCNLASALVCCTVALVYFDLRQTLEQESLFLNVGLDLCYFDSHHYLGFAQLQSSCVGSKVSATNAQLRKLPKRKSIEGVY